MTYDVAVLNDQDSGFTATVMGWPSCIARGSTREEALRKLREDLSNRLSEVEIVPVEVDALQPNPILKFAGCSRTIPSLTGFWKRTKPIAAKSTQTTKSREPRHRPHQPVPESPSAN